MSNQVDWNRIERLEENMKDISFKIKILEEIYSKLFGNTPILEDSKNNSIKSEIGV